jgi:type II restriction/modification system DNA methylase subunit YeeA
VIHADLTGGSASGSALDLTKARRLKENLGIAFMGDTKGGDFDIPGDLARQWLSLPRNPNGRLNSDAVRPWWNSMDVTRGPRDRWIIDFGVDMSEADAALYQVPFEHVRIHVKPERDKNRRRAYRDRWWIHVEPRPAMRAALRGLHRFLVTPTVAKHRMFAWSPTEVLPDHQLYAFARDDDYIFGVLQSRFHEIWSLRLGTSLEDRPRYTATTTFETFPLPVANPAQVRRVAEAAAEVDRLRRSWLQPPGASTTELRGRTLTALYNERPTWLANAHAALDAAVAEAYGWPKEIGDNEVLERLLDLNLKKQPA